MLQTASEDKFRLGNCYRLWPCSYMMVRLMYIYIQELESLSTQKSNAISAEIAAIRQGRVIVDSNTVNHLLEIKNKFIAEMKKITELQFICESVRDQHTLHMSICDVDDDDKKNDDCMSFVYACFVSMSPQTRIL